MISADDIQIFNQRGEMLPIDEIEKQLAELGDAATKKRFKAVRVAYDAAMAAKDALQAAKDAVVERADDVRGIQEIIRRRFSAVDPVKAAKDWIATQRLVNFGPGAI